MGNIFEFINLIPLSPAVQDALGPFLWPIVASLLNLVAVGLIILIAWRLAVVMVQGMHAFNSAGEGGGFNIVKGTLMTAAATFAAGTLGFAALRWGMPFLLDYATGASTAVQNAQDLPTRTPIDNFFAKAPVVGKLFVTIQDVAKTMIILFGGVLLAKTGIDALRNTKYSADSAGKGGSTTSGNQFKVLQGALMRAGQIFFLGMAAYVLVDVGPQYLFSYLDQLNTVVNNSVKAG